MTFRNKRRPRALRAVTGWLIASLGLLWLALMLALTLVVAQQLFEREFALCDGYVERVAETAFPGWWNGASELPESDEQLSARMHHARLYSSLRLGVAPDGHLEGGLSPRVLRDITVPLETAVLFYDGDGEILQRDVDFLSFNYMTDAEWAAQTPETEYYGHYGYVELPEVAEGEQDPYALLRVTHVSHASLYAGAQHPDVELLRIVGTVDGARVTPATVSMLTWTQYWQALSAAGPTDEYTGEDGALVQEYSRNVYELDRQGLLYWHTLFDESDALPAGETVTLYARSPDIYGRHDVPLRYRGESFPGLAALTEDLDFPNIVSGEQYGLSAYSPLFRGQSEYSLRRIVHFSGVDARDWSLYDGGETKPPARFTMVVAVAAYPLRDALFALRTAYLWSFALTLLVFLIVRARIRDRLIAPLRDVNEAAADNWRLLHRSENAPTPWREAGDALSLYDKARDRMRMDANERKRLETALSYAKRAEENRRLLVSNLAHELKTPLAVVHSYAEGLQAHIADEKREQYLATILSETERMDAMVLEMLDLSRLEAGRVRLARDEVSLSALARAAFERLAPLAEEKGLHIEYAMDSGALVGDEARLSQAVENLASNAVRYTPPGGTVTVRVEDGRSTVRFAVENTGDPLPPETLSRVWESFFRAEESRSGRGTGLGLAIVRGIVTLHGGSVAAENTRGGVVFSFTLPSGAT